LIHEGSPPEGVKIDVIGGCVIQTENSPPGLIFSQSYGSITEHNVKLRLCLLLSSFSVDSVKINEIIKKINAENFLTAKMGDIRDQTAADSSITIGSVYGRELDSSKDKNISG
jgi:hypothetical protein